MRKLASTILILVSSFAYAQEETNIVQIIDGLRVQWDEAAIGLKDYQGIQNFCATAAYRLETTQLLDAIHHWDTTLYFIVQSKYEASEDPEAIATLQDIELLETEYSTQNFKVFIENECDIIDEIENSFGEKSIKRHEKDIKEFEKELVKYLNSITYRVDIIDEHIHHLKLD